MPTKATTLLGTPNDGASVDEGLRSFRRASDYNAKAAGVYVQDLAQLRPDFKLLGGLRLTTLAGEYFSNAIPNNAQTPVTRTSYRMTVNQWSWRAGALWQPSPLQSFHASAAVLQHLGRRLLLNAANQNIPPEKAMNLELGAKLDSEDGDFSTRFAIFRTTKLHERNTDPLTPDIVTLSGKRHAAGVEMDFSGQVGDGWQVFASWMWLPIAKIDVSSANSGELQATALADAACHRHLVGHPRGGYRMALWRRRQCPGPPGAQPQPGLGGARLRHRRRDGRVPARRERPHLQAQHQQPDQQAVR